MTERQGRGAFGAPGEKAGNGNREKRRAKGLAAIAIGLLVFMAGALPAPALADEATSLPAMKERLEKEPTGKRTGKSQGEAQVVFSAHEWEGAKKTEEESGAAAVVPGTAAAATGQSFSGNGMGGSAIMMGLGGLLAVGGAIAALDGLGDEGASAGSGISHGGFSNGADTAFSGQDEDGESCVQPSVSRGAHWAEAGAGLVCAQEANRMLGETSFTINAHAGSTPQIYAIINLHYAAAADYDGTGQTIAIMDYNFDADHPEFADRVVGQMGGVGQTNKSWYDHHGTHVAGIAAAARDGKGVTGVASGADIHFASYVNGDLRYSRTRWWERAIDAAYQAGAVVHNNSWGWGYRVVGIGGKNLPPDIRPVLEAMAKGKSAGEALSMFHGSYGFAEDFNAFARALDNFQRQGVVVWAHDNNRDLPYTEISAALPALYPELAESWIAVSNLDIYRSGGGLKHRLVSAPCGATAAYCLAQMGGSADSPVRSAYRGGGYGDLYGASMAAPQVSGAVALLNQAFPNHTPSEITARLLATADNDLGKYGERIEGDTLIGVRDFGNGVQHGYYALTGHGIMDLRKALQPIGGLVVASKNTASPDAGRASLDSTSLAMSAPFGESLAQALGERDMAVFDALNGGFALKARQLLRENGREARGRRGAAIDLNRSWAALRGARKRQTIALSGSLSLDVSQPEERPFRTQPYTDPQSRAGLSLRLALGERAALSLGWRTDQADAFNLHGEALADMAGIVSKGSFALSHLDALREAVALSLNARGERLTWGISAMVGNAGRVDDGSWAPGGRNMGLMGRIGFDIARNARLALAGGAMVEEDSFLGAWGGGALALNESTPTAFVGVSARIRLHENVTLIASYGSGLTQPEAAYGTLFDGISEIRTEQFSIGLVQEDGLVEGDRLTLSLSQPMRVRAGRAALTLASGRNREGIAEFEDVFLDLSPEGRQMDLGFSWDIPLRPDLMLSGGWAVHFEPGHRRNARPEASALFGLRYRY